MKLWLDDVRPAPEGWTWVASVKDAIVHAEIIQGVTEVSLDHDLGEMAEYGGDGIKFIDWCYEADFWPEKITIHSMNPVGRDNMMRAIKASGNYTKFTHNSAEW